VSRPLLLTGQALRDFATDKSALLSLLQPVQRASGESMLAKELADSGELFRTLAWTPAEALRFLHEVPAFEAAALGRQALEGIFGIELDSGPRRRRR